MIGTNPLAQRENLGEADKLLMNLSHDLLKKL